MFYLFDIISQSITYNGIRFATSANFENIIITCDILSSILTCFVLYSLVFLYFTCLGTPLLTHTGTADMDTEKTIIHDLVMNKTVKLFVCPNRVNLRPIVKKVSRKHMLKQLDWILEMIREHDKETPKTIIFCDTLYSIASVWNYLIMSLGENVFHPPTSRKHKHCVLGIYHSLSLKEYKETFGFF